MTIVKRLSWILILASLSLILLQSSKKPSDGQPVVCVPSVSQQIPSRVVEVLETPESPEPKEVVPEIVERVVAAEARGESIENQMAVAQTILETSVATCSSISDVATNGQYAPPVQPDLVTDSVREACYRVLYIGERVTEEPIRYFYSTGGGFYSKWHETSPNLEYVTTIDDHKFYKLKENAK